MYKTVIFDLDGTLLDTIEDLAAAGNFVCRSFGWAEYTTDDYKAMVGHGIDNLLAHITPPDTWREPQQVLERFNLIYRVRSRDRTRPYPGIPEMLARLDADGVQMAVYSNKPDEFTTALIGSFYPGVFSLVQGKKEDIPVKPDPTGLHKILETLHASPSETLFVGDSSTDVRTGHNAGLPVCAVTWGYRSRESLERVRPEAIADDAATLEAVIRQGVARKTESAELP